MHARMLLVALGVFGFAAPASAQLSYLDLHRESESVSARIVVRHDMDGPVRVTVEANGQTGECETPCSVVVDPGPVRIRAGRVSDQITAAVRGNHEVIVDVGWDDASFGLWVAGLASLGVGVVLDAVLAATAATGVNTYCTVETFGACPAGYQATQDWFVPVLLTAIPLTLFGAVVAMIGVNEGPMGALHFHQEAARTRGASLDIGWGVVRVRW